MKDGGLIVLCIATLIVISRGDETKPVDIVTYLDSIYDELLYMQLDVEHGERRSPLEVLQSDQVVKLQLEDTVKGIEDMIEKYNDMGRLTENARYCIETVLQSILDTMFDHVKNLQEHCADITEDVNKVNAISSQIAVLKPSVRNLQKEFVAANLWCATNKDEAPCYENAIGQVSQKAIAIMNHINELKSSLAEARGHYDLKFTTCSAMVTENAKYAAKYVYTGILDCLS